MRKLNLNVMIKILILLGFSIFYLKIIISKEILLYVNPRIIPFSIFGMISMFIISLFLILDSLKTQKKKVKFKNYIIFILPLIIIFFMQNTTINSFNITSKINLSNAQLNFNSNNNYNTNSNTPKFNKLDKENNIFSQNYTNSKNIKLENNIIEVNVKNFISSLDEILKNPDKYNNKQVHITGFVFRDEFSKKNDFIIGRFLMACCSADMQIVGIKCIGDNLESYDDNTWVNINGKIKKITNDENESCIITIEDIEKDSNPDTSYVYPF